MVCEFRLKCEEITPWSSPTPSLEMWRCRKSEAESGGDPAMSATTKWVQFKLQHVDRCCFTTSTVLIPYSWKGWVLNINALLKSEHKALFLWLSPPFSNECQTNQKNNIFHVIYKVPNKTYAVRSSLQNDPRKLWANLSLTCHFFTNPLYEDTFFRF